MDLDFVNQMWPHALRVSQRTGLDPRLVVAQSALETGYGKHSPGNNYFGIKSHGKSGGNTFATNEVINGRTVRVNDSFRGYPDMGASADGYADFLLENKRYRPVMAAQGLEAQIAAMGGSGYATDPNYTSKLSAIAGKIPRNFAPEDTPQAIARDALAAIGKGPAPMDRQPTISTSGGSTTSLLGGIADDTMETPMEPEKARGILGSLFPDMTADKQDRISLALSGLSMNPSIGSMSAVRDRMDNRRTDMKEAKAGQAAAAQANKTAAWLATQPGGEQFAQAIASGALPAGQALEMWRSQAKGTEPTALVQQYNLAREQGYGGTFMDYQTDLKKAGASQSNVTVNNSDGSPADADLRKELNKDEGALWGTYLKTGGQSAALNQDFEILDELIQMAPQGPISGRLAEAFPGVSSAGDAFNSIVKRLAPTMRAEGSGSTSDIEYSGMLKSLPSLLNKPEANALISQVMRSKAQINMERGQVVQQYQNGSISAVQARQAIADIDSRSIMSPEMKRLLLGVAPKDDAPDGIPEVGAVVDGYRFTGGDPGDQNNWVRAN